MRKILLSFFIIFTTLAVQAQIVNIPDANFKNALLTHNPVIDLNADGQIQVSEATAFTGAINVAQKNIADLTGINAFPNINALFCSYNKLTSLSLNSFPLLLQIFCDQNLLTSFQFTGLPALKELRLSYNKFTSLTISNLPALTILSCYNNQLTSLSLSNVNSLKGLACAANLLTSLPLNAMPGLQLLDCSYNKFTVLTATGLNFLTDLDCSYNQLTSVTLGNPGILQRLYCSNNNLTAIPAGLNALQILVCSNNQITSLDLTNSASLNFLDFSSNACTGFSLSNKNLLTDILCDGNQLSALTLSNLPALRKLSCVFNQLVNLSLLNFPALFEIYCDHNQLISLTVSNMPSLTRLYCTNNKLPSLSVTNLPLLGTFTCSHNELTALTVSNLPALSQFYCDHNLLTNLPLSNLPSLYTLVCSSNKMTSLSLNNFPALYNLVCSDNKLKQMALSNLPAINFIHCQQNLFDTLAIGGFTSLKSLECGMSDTLTCLSLTNLLALDFIECRFTKLVVMDLSQTGVKNIRIEGHSLLQYINLKNGAIIPTGFYNEFHNLPSLVNICADTAEIAYLRTMINSQLPGQNVAISSLCSFIPSYYNTIKGTVRFDGNNNGCTNEDSSINNLKIKINSGPDTGYTFTNTQGRFTYFVIQNPNTVKPVFGNTYFNTTPMQQIFNFPGFGDTAIANFCVTPNGVHPDLDITLIPVGRARPGIDANYELVYRNKGNQILSGTVYLLFDISKMNLVLSSPPATNQPPGTLSWPYVNFSPFETKVINLKFHINAPPIVNGGDTLSFIATIYHTAGDETPEDNKHILKQIVTNSIDPNEKEVTEGSQVSIDKLGEYLHYIVHFQNTGTAEAIMVRVRDSLSANLDWNSFEPIIASHPYRAVISKGNLAEFIFDGINLPPKSVNEPASNGFISFKIKPKNTLVVGDSIQNKAAIYFDFNLPVVTNTVTTKIYKLAVNNVSGITIYTNPTKNYLSFSVKPGVEIKAINLFNSMGQKMNIIVSESTGSNRKIDVSHLATGVYFLELTSNLGKLSQKVMIAK